MGCSPWSCKELDVTVQLRHTSTFSPCSVLANIFYPQMAPDFYLHDFIFQFLQFLGLVREVLVCFFRVNVLSQVCSSEFRLIIVTSNSEKEVETCSQERQ